MHLARGPVNFVGQQQVRKNRTLTGVKGIGAGVENFAAKNVGREQVHRELNAVEGEVDRLGKDRDKQRLGQARHALQKEVAASEKCDEQSFDDFILPRTTSPTRRGRR